MKVIVNLKNDNFFKIVNEATGFTALDTILSRLFEVFKKNVSEFILFYRSDQNEALNKWTGDIDVSEMNYISIPLKFIKVNEHSNILQNILLLENHIWDSKILIYDTDQLFKLNHIHNFEVWFNKFIQRNNYSFEFVEDEFNDNKMLHTTYVNNGCFNRVNGIEFIDDFKHRSLYKSLKIQFNTEICYFNSGFDLIETARYILNNNIHFNGEHPISQVYNDLRMSSHIFSYEVDKMIKL